MYPDILTRTAIPECGGERARNNVQGYCRRSLPMEGHQGPGPKHGLLASEQLAGRQEPQEPGQLVHVAGLLEGLAHARHLVRGERHVALGLQEVGHGDGAAGGGGCGGGSGDDGRARRGTLAERLRATAGRRAHAARASADEVPRRQVRRHDGVAEPPQSRWCWPIKRAQTAASRARRPRVPGTRRSVGSGPRRDRQQHGCRNDVRWRWVTGRVSSRACAANDRSARCARTSVRIGGKAEKRCATPRRCVYVRARMERRASPAVTGRLGRRANTERGDRGLSRRCARASSRGRRVR